MIELPIIMASLEIDDTQVASDVSAVQNNSIPDNCPEVSRRVFRKRVQGTYQPCESSKRRCSLRPKKLSASQETDDMKNYFVSKKFRSFKKTLATIYEEPKIQKNGTVVHTGAPKLRQINFSIISKDKIRKRKAKVKKVLGHKSPRKGRMSMEAFVSRLKRLMAETPSNIKNNKNVINALVKCEVE